MSYSHYSKVFTQLKAKPAKLEKYKKHNSPNPKRSCGVSQRRCQFCGRIRGHVRKYGLNLCRQCLRETAPKLGFKKYR
jgi:small subunit ribosomal protein S14